MDAALSGHRLTNTVESNGRLVDAVRYDSRLVDATSFGVCPMADAGPGRGM